MTFNEILAQVQRNVWGNTTPPANATADITDVIIPNVHRRIQMDYNYGFMQTWTEIATTLGADGVLYNQSYALPDSFKEIIAVNWNKVDSEGDYVGRSGVLTPVLTGQAQASFWKSDNIYSVEYPTHFEIYNQTIVFYPEPNAVRTAIVSYFQVLACPAGANEDALLRDGDEAVIAKATSLYYVKRHEMEMAAIWEQRFLEEESRLRSFDFARRQSQFKETLPDDYQNLYE